MVRTGIALQALGVVAALGVLGLLVLQRGDTLSSTPGSALRAALRLRTEQLQQQRLYATPAAMTTVNAVAGDGGGGNGDDASSPDLLASESFAAGGVVPVLLLTLMVVCGVFESLGSPLLRGHQRIGAHDVEPRDPVLSWVNTAMANIDLLAEIVGPAAAWRCRPLAATPRWASSQSASPTSSPSVLSCCCSPQSSVQARSCRHPSPCQRPTIRAPPPPPRRRRRVALLRRAESARGVVASSQHGPRSALTRVGAAAGHLVRPTLLYRALAARRRPYGLPPDPRALAARPRHIPRRGSPRGGRRHGLLRRRRERVGLRLLATAHLWISRSPSSRPPHRR